MNPPSGEQVEIRHGDLSAAIVEVGGGIRELRAGDLDVLDGYPAGAMADGGRGAPLLPWPNRIDGGRYEFGGRRHQLPLTEVPGGNAIHGLTRWIGWRLEPLSRAGVRCRTAIHPQPGYPFHLRLEVEYHLGPGGLTVTTTAANAGRVPLPYAAGHHPYLAPGPAGARVDDAGLSLRARTLIVTDARGLPAARRALAGSELAFTRAGGLIGDRRLDACLTDLERDRDGRFRAILRRTDGRSTTLWLDAAYTCLMVYTGDTLQERPRLGLALEPMTAPPNAFATGQGLLTLLPGETARAAWGISF